MPDWLRLIIALGLVALNGFFVLAEFALVKVRSTRIEELAASGSVLARTAQRAVNHLDAYLSATQLGITIASIGFGMVLEPVIANLLHAPLATTGLSEAAIHTISFWIAFLIGTFLHIVFGELAPKSIAIARPEASALFSALPLHWFYRTFLPFIWVLNHTAWGVLKLFGIKPASEHELAHSEEEIRMILSESALGGVLKDTEVALVKNVFNFGDKHASDVMVPRVDFDFLSTTWPLERNLKVAQESGHTRFPLCDGDADHCIGMVHIKDLIRVANEPDADLRNIRRDILMVPETKGLDQLLHEFRHRRMHMALVIDEYGGAAGLVTLEDVIEEIVGEITDEFEREDSRLRQIAPNQWEIDGGVAIADLREQIKLQADTNGSDTIGGFVLDHMGAIPEVGSSVRVDGYLVEVVAMEDKRVRTVRVTHDPTETATAQSPPS
jgi:CBS domain containing-hemolysin-like protein